MAWRLFDARGYEATTCEEIAREAGVSRRTFFRCFSSKEDVVVGTSDALAEHMIAAFDVRPASESPLEAIRGALRQVVGAALADAAQARAILRLFRESRSVRRALLARHALMEERLAERIAARTGSDLSQDRAPLLLAFVARALMDTAFVVWFDQAPADTGALTDDLFDLLRDVVGAREGVPRPGRG